MKPLLPLTLLFFLWSQTLTAETSNKEVLILGSPKFTKHLHMQIEENNEISNYKILQQMFAPLGYTISVKFMENYGRVIAELSKGNIDVIPGFISSITPTPSAPDIICSKSTFFNSYFGLFALKQKQIKLDADLTNLKQYKIAALLLPIEEYLPSTSKEQLSLHRDMDQIYKMLITDRVDVALASPNMSHYWETTYQADMKELVRLGKYSLNLCFSTKSLGEEKARSIVDKLDRAPRLKNLSN